MELRNLSDVEVYLNKVIERQSKDLSIILSGLGIRHDRVTPELLMSVAVSNKAPLFFAAVERIGNMSNFTAATGALGLTSILPAKEPSVWEKIGNTIKDVVPILKGGVEIYNGVKSGGGSSQAASSGSSDKSGSKEKNPNAVDENTKKFLVYGFAFLAFLIVLMVIINLLKKK